MSKIEQEIEQVAENMEKSTKTAKERLFQAILELGPEGLRAKIPTLEKAEQELLKETLEEMKKAVSMDKEYQAKYVRGNINDTIIQEDKADDDQDEKLVMKEAAKQHHQGTPVEGWEGQVIKSDKEDKKEEKSKEKAAEAVDEIAEQEAEEAVKEHEDEMHKDSKKVEKSQHMEKKQGVPAGVDPEKHERCVRKVKKTGAKNPYAVCNAAMKKGEITDEVREALNEIRKSVEEQLTEMGIEPSASLVKSEMKRLLKEEEQNGDAPEMNEKTRANKDAPKELKVEEENDAAQKKVDDLKQGMRKATWAEENSLLKANTFGRNFHFSYEEYLEAMAKQVKEEPVKKSDSGKEDLNDIIAKSQDRTWDHLNADRLLQENKSKINGRVSKSFETSEIAQALGLSAEEAKKILGE